MSRPSTKKWCVTSYGDSDSGIAPQEIELISNDNGIMRTNSEGVTSSVRFLHSARSVTLIGGGRTYEFQLPDVLIGEADTGVSDDRLLAPMPGIVKQINAKTGQVVEQNEPLIIMEAMKMELTLSAPRHGSVAEITVQEGDQVTDGDILLALEPVDEKSNQ